jgi:hypothetical protein
MQYASGQNPLGNFYRGSNICKALFHPDIQSDPDKLAMAYAFILCTKQVDGSIEILAHNKKNTPDSIKEKLLDVSVYYLITAVIDEIRQEKKNA